MSIGLRIWLSVFLCFSIVLGASAQKDFVSSEIIVELAEGYGYMELSDLLGNSRYYVASIERKLAQSRHIYLLNCKEDQQADLLRSLARNEMFEQVFPTKSHFDKKKDLMIPSIHNNGHLIKLDLKMLGNILQVDKLQMEMK